METIERTLSYKIPKSFYWHNKRAMLIRFLMKVAHYFRPIPPNPHAPWSPIDAFIHGQVKIGKKYYDLAFEMPFKNYAEWDKMWQGYIKDCETLPDIDYEPLDIHKVDMDEYFQKEIL